MHRDPDGPSTEEKNVAGNFIRKFLVETTDDITKDYMDLKNCGQVIAKASKGQKTEKLLSREYAQKIFLLVQTQPISKIVHMVTMKSFDHFVLELITYTWQNSSLKVRKMPKSH